MPASPQTTTADPEADPEPDPVEQAVAALADLPPGAALGAALAALDPATLTGHQWVDVLIARQRQGNHERGQLFAAVEQVLLHQLTTTAEGKVKEPDEYAVDEVRAALRLTRVAALDLGGLVWDLRSRMPAVTAAMRAGLIDQPRARVFSAWTHGLSEEHTQAVVAALLPKAPTLTTGQLIDAIKRHAIALDPEWARRRYERALRGRRVVGRRNPDRTANLSGYDLPLDGVAAACARLDALARAAKAAGHPGRIDHLRAELFLGMTDGRYSAMTDQHILATLLATATATEHAPATDGPHGEDSGGEDSGGEDPDGDDPGVGDAEGEGAADGDDTADDGPDGEDPGGDGGGSDDDPPDRDGRHDGDPDGEDLDGEGPDGENPADRKGPDRGPKGDGPGGAGLPGQVGRRGGLRLWAGLSTLVGADRRPAELIGWGPLHAELSRDLALRLTSWWCIFTDTVGTPQTIVPIRRRPTTTTTHSTTAHSGRIPGELWIQIGPDTLPGLARRADTDPGWARSWPRSSSRPPPPAAAHPPTTPPPGCPGRRCAAGSTSGIATASFPACATRRLVSREVRGLPAWPSQRLG